MFARSGPAQLLPSGHRGVPTYLRSSRGSFPSVGDLTCRSPRVHIYGACVNQARPLSHSSHRDNGALSHLNRGIDGVFEIVRVVGCGLVSIAEVHAIVARAYLA